MNTDYVPEDVLRHIDDSWPARQRVSQRLAIPAYSARVDRNLLGPLENDVATQLAIALTHNQWVMLTTTGPRWLLWNPPDAAGPPGLRTSIDDIPAAALLPWDGQVQSLEGVPGHALLICEIQGCAVPTFLESAPAAAAEVADAAAAAHDGCQG